MTNASVSNRCIHQVKRMNFNNNIKFNKKEKKKKIVIYYSVENLHTNIHTQKTILYYF